MEMGYIGFFIVLCAVIILRSEIHRREKKIFYDERQIAVRGKAYKIGFLTTVYCNIGFCFLMMIREEMRSYGMGFLVISFFAGILLFLIYSIWKDAFLPIHQKFATYLCICAVVTISQFINYFSYENWRNFSEILQNEHILSLCCGTLFLIVMVMLIVKRMMDKREELDQ
ncbi:MAG: hypothetical protein Q4B01_06885 [Eubacteriales bacterium]|nr:hypothetical protein [Eubacteriales bacterium]